MNRTVVIISSVAWHFSWQRHHDIAQGLADRGYQLIFVDPLPKRFPGRLEWKRVLGRLMGSGVMAGKYPQDLPRNISLISPVTLPDIGLLFYWINRVLFIPFLKARIERISSHPISVINYLPTITSLYLQNVLGPEISIYDCTVDWQQLPSAKGTLIVEEAMIQQADYVLADSPYLFEKLKIFRPDSHLVLPAVHFDDFEIIRNDRRARTGEIKCVYFGGIRSEIDLKLLADISRLFNLRIIGPIEIPIDGLFEDAELIGPITYSQLPEYLIDTDVILLPYDKQIPNVRAIIPAKTFQCLATGKPTVVYGLENLEMFKEYFSIAESYDDCLAKIRSSVVNDTIEKRNQRLAVAKSNDWEKRIDFLNALLQVKPER